MPSSILMPALSPTMTDGKLSRWLKKEGDVINAGEVIAEIETDKATMEVEAAEAGKIGKILVPAGTDAVAVNARIAVLLEDGEGDAELQAFLANDNAKPQAAVAAEAAAPPKMSAAPVAVSASGTRVFASPLAKRIAQDKGVDLASVKGTGPHGRIVRADIEAANANTASAPKSVASRPAASGMDARRQADLLGMAYEAVPNSGMRKTIASRLSESKQTVPHFYLTVDCRLDALLAARKTLNDASDGKFKLSVNDFIIKACAVALQKVPAANTSWTDDAILQFKDSDISVAVATPTGLITPIIKAAQGKTLSQISGEMKDLASRARDGKLKPTEYQGGTFSLSNLGMFGIKDFAAIINPPQACILAVGAGIEQPVVANGKIEVGTVMSVTLSVDHRCVDGAVGAEYLQVFKSIIENPLLMLA